MLTLVLVAGLLGLTVMSFIFYQKAKAMERAQQLPPGYGGGAGFTPAGQLPAAGHGQLAGERDLQNLKIGDIVSHFGTDYLVEGRLDYWEDGYTWVTYMLVDNDVVRWLAVEMDDVLEISLWEPLDDLVVRQPIPEFLEYHGVRYQMVERGRARVTQQGRVGRRSGQQAEYYEFESGGEWSLSIEAWGSDIEASRGQAIRAAELEILPGDAIEAPV